MSVVGQVTNPSSKLFQWAAAIAAVLVIAVVIDQYWGKKNMFGLKKTETA